MKTLLLFLVFMLALTSCGTGAKKTTPEKPATPASPPASPVENNFEKMNPSERHEALFEAIKKCDEKTMEQLLSLAPDLKSRKKMKISFREENVTPLQYAATGECPTAVRLLLEAQAPINVGDRNGDSTPLVRAIHQMGEVLNDLKSHRVELKPKNQDRLKASIKKIDLLLDHNADPNWPSRQGGALIAALYAAESEVEESAPAIRELFEKLIAHKVDLNAKDWRQRNLLMVASETGDVELVRMIRTQTKSAIDATDPSGMTALSYAISQMQFTEGQEWLKRQEKVAEYLLQEGAQINPTVMDRGGAETFLRVCSREGHLNSVKFMLAHHLKPTSDDADFAADELQKTVTEYGPNPGDNIFQRPFSATTTGQKQRKEIIKLLREAAK